MMTKKVIIVGAGEQGAVALNCLNYDKGLRFVGFLDDASLSSEHGDILGKVADCVKWKDCYFHIAIGKNSPRKKVFEFLQSRGCKCITLVHPRAFVEPGVTIGQNVFIGANAYVNVESKIGDNTIINNGCVVEHDNIVGNHCHLTPGVVTGGGVTIGDSVFIGLRSVIRDHIKVGNNVFIGMGSVITKDVASGILVHNKLELAVKKYI